MVKTIFFVICLISTFDGSSTSTNIECSYGVGVGYVFMGSIYRCIVNINPNILTKESVKISGVNGTLDGSKSSNDVIGFHADQKTIQFFPKGLEKFFKNIKAITLYYCKLKEIHQSDLKVFLKLGYFYLNGNEIEVIEEGLFDFNPNLEVIGLWESRIVHIDPNVFDHSNKLRFFWFKNFPCVDRYGDTKEQVPKVLKVIKSNCSNSEFLILENQINNLETESKTLSSEALSTKIETFEESFNNSIFSKFRPLNYKFQNFKLALGTQIDLIQKEILISDLKIFTDKFEDLKTSQCGLERPVNELKTSQITLQTAFNSLKLSVTSQESKLNQIQKTQNQIQEKMVISINNVISKVGDVTSTQNALKSSISQIEVKVNNLKSLQSSSINVLGSKISGLETTQNNLKSDVNEIKSLVTAHGSKLDQTPKTHNMCTSDSLSTLGSILNNFRASHDQMSKTFTDLKTDLDSKLKLVENRLMEKIDEKLNKILKGLNIEN